MEKSGAKAYLVNTGWNGTGKRITIKDTRGIIDAILSGDILKAPTKIQVFLTHVTHMQMHLSGRQKQKILLTDSSRTLLNMKETTLVKH